MNRPLWQLAAIRIIAFGLLAAIAQMAVVFSDYYFNDEELGRLLVEQQVDALSEGVTRDGTSVGYVLPDESADLFAPGSDYFARVRTADGAILFSACDTICQEHFLPPTIQPPDFWVRVIAPGKPLHVAGGGRVERDDEGLLIEFATIGDSDGLVWGVLWHEVLDHLVIPMGILLVFVIFGTILSIRSALEPVHKAVEAADGLDPLNLGAGLPTAAMPEEIRHLTQAVNKAFVRMGELIRSQRLLTSAIAHEVRTPLSIVKLELSSLDHPTARRVETQLDELADFVAQLTALARLEALDAAEFEPTDLSLFAEEIVATMAPWVLAQGDTIAFEDQGAATVVLAPSLVRDACRNLIENAVRHAPAATAITLKAGPGPTLTIENEGQDGVRATKSKEGLGIGLTVVERVLEKNRARMASLETRNGMTVTITFSNQQ